MSIGRMGGHFLVHIPIRFVLILLTVSTVLTLLIIRPYLGNAETVTIAPSSCSGDWLYPEHALQESSVFDTLDTSALEKNSAILIDGSQKLFCTFGRSTPDADRMVSRAVIDLTISFEHDAWGSVSPIQQELIPPLLLDNERATSSADIVPEFRATDISSAEIAQGRSTSSLDQVIDSEEITEPVTGEEQDVIVEDETTIDTVSDGAQPSSMTEDPVQTQPDILLSEPNSTEPQPQSLLWRFFTSPVFASELAETEAETSMDTSDTPNPPGSVISADDTQTTIRVMYTIDGVMWSDLGTVSDSGTFHFDIPVTRESELENLVVRLQADPFQADDRAFVDSVSLSLVYASEMVQDRLQGIASIDTNMPNILESRFEAFKGLKNTAVFIARTDAGRALYVLSLDGDAVLAQRVAGGTLLMTDTPLGIKGGRVFWQSAADTVYSYRLEDGAYFTQILIKDTSEQHAQFEDFPWNVFVRGGEFFFSATDTGEVTSDDDSSVKTAFVTKFIGPLDRDDLMQLGLVSDETLLYDNTTSDE